MGTWGERKCKLTHTPGVGVVWGSGLGSCIGPGPHTLIPTKTLSFVSVRLGVPVLVMFRPGLAWKPGLWPGFSWLWLCDIMGQAIGHGFGLFMAWLGLGHGFLTNRCSMLVCAWTTCA